MSAPFLQDHDGALVAWFRRHRRALDFAIFATALAVVALFAGQFIRVAVQ